ncbi:MAG: hypothetical protein JNK34_04690, partial [Tabrizicola sp.]|nr:hypothetical protein [Tabrizicola sp.]
PLGPPPVAKTGGAGSDARLEGQTVILPPEGATVAAAVDVSATGTPEAAGTKPVFAGDTSPSVAPTEKTIRPLPRPEGLKAEDSE